jgi:transcriptional regulator with XRE-family HTH domain
MNNQPRRYRIRRLHDVEGLTQQEIAGKLGVSQATVQRDLNGTTEPDRKTPGGAPVYPFGRFNDDPEFQERVAQLAVGLPLSIARRQAAREFAGTPDGGRMLGQVGRIRSEEDRAEEMRRAFGVRDGGAAAA